MADFGIIFSGLICHAKINKNTRAAVIIRDNKHAARIWVKDGGLTGDDPTFQEAKDTVNGWKLFVIPNDARIQFDGLTQGKVADPPDIEVAHLKELLAPGFEM